MSYGPVNPAMPFLSTSEVYPENEEQLRVKQTHVYSNIANSVNIREIAIYDLQQLLTGQQFFNPADVQNLRYTFRKVFNLGAKASGGTYTIATGISNLVMFTRMYGTCITDAAPGGDYRPIPYVDEATITDQISLKVVPNGSSYDLLVKVGATSPNVISGMVVLEYILA